MTSDLSDEELDRRVATGDEDALATLFDRHRARLERMVQIRLDPRVKNRMDAEDVLQEAFLAAQIRTASFAEQEDLTGFVWLRLITGQTLVDVHRRHLGAQMRNAAEEVRLSSGPKATSETISFQLIATLSSPSQVAMKAELSQRLVRALDAMDEIDREVLVLRHFEELSNNEVAAVLDLQKSAASNRYVRALGRLKTILDQPDTEVPQ